MNRWVLPLAGLIVGIVIGASAMLLAKPAGRYQMAIIPASPVKDEMLLIVDTATGDGKVFIGKNVQGFSYAREEITQLRDLKRTDAQQ